MFLMISTAVIIVTKLDLQAMANMPETTRSETIGNPGSLCVTRDII